MNTILVTGGAGYIGSHAAAALLEEGHKVIVLDNLSTGSRELVPKGAVFVQGDVSDPEKVQSLLRAQEVEAIFHFAAFVNVAEAEREEDKYIENNVRATEALLFSAKQAGVAKFVFSSTAAVYGNPELVPVPEDWPAKPVGVYGKSKLLAEQLVQDSGLHYVIFRYFNVAGAHQRKLAGYRIDKEPSHLIRKAVRVALGDYPELDLFGTDYPTPDGSAVRDYIHVSDLVQAHLDALRYLGNAGISDIFNVGYGRGYSVLQVIDALERVIGRKIKVNYTERRKGDSMIIVADNRKIIKTLGWQSKHASLDAMITDELKWVEFQKL